jgi:hypothetical protein
MSRLDNPFFPPRCITSEAERLIDEADDLRLQRESELESQGRVRDSDWPDFLDEQDD